MTSLKQSTKKNQAKETIGALCHILNSNGRISRISPEHFRQAKFDHAGAIPAMWTLLHELTVLQFTSLEKHHTSPSSLDQEQIKSVLYHCGYRCHGFYGDGEVGSRDVLLVLGWFLAKSEFMNKQVEACLERDVLPISTFQLNVGDVRLDGKRTKQVQQGASPAPVNTPLGQARYLVWTMGRTRLALKALHSEQRALCTAMHRVHEATHGVTLHPQCADHLTAWETFLLRHPQHLKGYLEQLEKQASLLQACLVWKELEPVFWQWMVSVHEAKLSSDLSNRAPPTPNPAPPPVFPSLVREGSVPDRIQELCDLEEMLTRQLHDLEGELSARGVHEVIGQVSNAPDLIKMKSDIENSIRAKLAVSYDEPRGPPSKNFPIHTVQIAFKPPLPNANRHERKDAVPDNAVNIKTEILQLTGCVRRLEEDLEELRSKQREKFDEFEQNLNNIVCIPPMSTRTKDLFS